MDSIAPVAEESHTPRRLIPLATIAITLLAGAFWTLSSYSFGGPGIPHDYLQPLADLADDRPVIFYDQLGCGRSAGPDDPALWTMDRAVEEVAAVRAALSLDRMHLFGNSWGGPWPTSCRRRAGHLREQLAHGVRGGTGGVREPPARLPAEE